MTTLQRKNGEIYGDLPVPTKLDYDFMGWYTEKNGHGNKINATDIINTISNYTIYAYYELTPLSIDLFKDDTYITGDNTQITIPFDGVLTYNVTITQNVRKTFNTFTRMYFNERYYSQLTNRLAVLQGLGNVILDSATTNSYISGITNVKANDILTLHDTYNGGYLYVNFKKYKNALADINLTYMILTAHKKEKTKYFPLANRFAYLRTGDVSSGYLYTQYNDETAYKDDKIYIKLTDDEIHLFGSSFSITVDYSDLNIAERVSKHYKKIQFYDCSKGYPPEMEQNANKIFPDKKHEITVEDSTGKRYQSFFVFRTMSARSNVWNEWQYYKYKSGSDLEQTLKIKDYRPYFCLKQY